MTSDPQSPSEPNDLLPDAGTPAAGPSRPRRLPIWRALGTVLSIALLVYLIWAQGWDKFSEALSRLPVYYFWIALGLTLLSRVSTGLRWFTLLRSAGVKITFWQSQVLTFMGLFAANFLPTTVGGDLVRLVGTVYLGIDPGVSAASLVMDRLVGMAGMASLAPFGLSIVLRSGSAAATSIPAMQWVLPPFLLRLPGVEWVYRKTEKFFRSLWHSSIYWIRHPWSLGLALLCTYGHMFLTFLSIWVLLKGMGQSLSFWSIGALWSLNYFITTLLPISINGLGLQELAISNLYSHFGGVSMEAALALAVLYRLLLLLASLPGAAFLPDILRPFPRGAQKVDVRQEMP